MNVEIVLSLTVGVLSLLVTFLIGWQIYNAITIEKRLKKLIKDSELKMMSIVNSKVSKVAGEIRFNTGQEAYDQQRYYVALFRFLEVLNLFSVAKDSGGVVLSQWFMLQAFEKGSLVLSEEDKGKMKAGLQNCYMDTGFVDYREQIFKLIV